MNTRTQTRPVEFFSEGNRLKGVLHLPEAENPPAVVGSHGLEGSKDSSKQMVLSRILPDRGIAFLRFDHRGCGESEGDFTDDTSVEKRSRDLVNAVDHLTGMRITANKICLFGSSFGGATCIAAWEKIMTTDVTLCGLVVCAAPVDSGTIKVVPTVQDKRRPPLPRTFYENNLRFDLTGSIKQIQNVLIFHGDSDTVVPVVNAHILYRNAENPKKRIVFQGGDHPMSATEDQKVFEKESAEWFVKCFSRFEAPS